MSVSERCCCGHRREFISPVIVNGIKHETYGPPGNFCGPILQHDCRDLEEKLVAKANSEAESRDNILAWLGRWRDKIQDKAVSELQDILL